MKIKEILSSIKGIFVPPKKVYYFGKLVYGTPYFYPMNFNPNILSVRKLELKSEEELNSYLEKYPHFRNRIQEVMFSNLPMVRRNKNWTFKIFNQWWHIQIGWPVYIYWNQLGWKDKFDSPRFEWCPAFYIFLFNWQFVIHWTAPDGDNDRYYKMILQYLYYQNRDIKKTEENWGWVDGTTKKSTWNEEYLINQS